MSNSVVAIINGLPQIESKRYLELGVGQRWTFDAVRAGSKVGVDVGSVDIDIYKMTTDEFFAAMSPDEQFDVVFIDACHDYQQALRDFNNAARHCAEGVVFLHDMVPPSVEFTAKHLCSDSFKLLWRLVQEKQAVGVLYTDFGLTAVVNPQPLAADPSWESVTYDQFIWLELPIVSLKEMMCAVGSTARKEVSDVRA